MAYHLLSPLLPPHPVSPLPLRLVNMAYLAVVGSAHVNGVAAIHSDIVKNDIFTGGAQGGRGEQDQEPCWAGVEAAEGGTGLAWALGLGWLTNGTRQPPECEAEGPVHAVPSPRVLPHFTHTFSHCRVLQALPQQVPEQDQRSDASPLARVVQPGARLPGHRDPGHRCMVGGRMVHKGGRSEEEVGKEGDRSPFECAAVLGICHQVSHASCHALRLLPSCPPALPCPTLLPSCPAPHLSACPPHSGSTMLSCSRACASWQATRTCSPSGAR